MNDKNKISPANNKKYIWVILALVAVIAGLSGYLIFCLVRNAQHSPQSFSKHYPLLDPARSFISKEHYISTLQPLREELQKMSENYGNDKISIYIEYLNSGANISINNDLRIWPASLAKLPLALAVTRKVEKGIWHWDNELVVMEQDRDEKSGREYGAAVGTRYTIRVLVEKMLIESDNTFYNILLRNMDNSEIEEVIEQVGLNDLFAEDGKVTAKEYSRLLRSLFVANYLSLENSEYLLYTLSKAEFTSFLSSGFPSEVRFAHKYGENTEKNVYLDSGIVYIPNRPVLITVAIEGKTNWQESKQEAENLMKQIAQLTYEYVTKK